MEPKVQYNHPSVQDDFKTRNDRRMLKKQMKIKKGFGVDNQIAKSPQLRGLFAVFIAVT